MEGANQQMELKMMGPSTGERQPVLEIQNEENLDDDDRRRTTNIQSLIHLLKGNIGPGCLSLPWAFSQLGFRVGLITTVFLAVLTAYNTVSIIHIKRAHLNHRSTSFGDLGEMAYGSAFSIFVTASLCLQQLSVCTVFFSFIGDNISSVVLLLSSSSSPAVDDDSVAHSSSGFTSLLENSRFIMTAIFPFVMILSCLPNLKVLAPVTAVGTLFLFVGFGLLGTVASLNWENRPTDSVDIDWRVFPLAISSIMYSFEGINLVLPVEAAMKTPEHFVSIYILAMVIIVLTYTLFSIMCVSAFGNVDDGSINAFLTKNAQNYVGDGWVVAANIVVSFSVLFSYPLQLFPCVASLSQIRYKRLQQSDNQPLPLDEPKPASPFIPLSNMQTKTNNTFTDSKQHIDLYHEADLEKSIQIQQHVSSMSGLDGDSPGLRTLLVFITFVAAIAIPNVQEMISLAGAFAGTNMALIIPPLVKLSTISSDAAKMKKLECWALTIFGSLLGIAGTLASLIEIFNSYVS